MPTNHTSDNTQAQQGAQGAVSTEFSNRTVDADEDKPRYLKPLPP